MQVACDPGPVGRLEVGHGVDEGVHSRDAGYRAATQALATIRNHALSAVLVFTSVRYNLGELLAGVGEVVGDVPVIGATTAGEFCLEPLSESVLVVALASPYLRVRVAVGRNVSAGWEHALEEALGDPQIRDDFDDARQVDPGRVREGKALFCLLLTPGNTRHSPSHSHEILVALRERSHGGMPIFGGAAADDWGMEANHVFQGTTAWKDSLVVAVFETELKFGIAMAHGFRCTSSRALVTRADGHEILELDGRIAGDTFASWVGLCREFLVGKHLTNHTGRAVGTADPLGRHAVNVVSFLTPRGGMLVTRPVQAGTELTLMEADPATMVEGGPEALRKAVLRAGMARPCVALVAYCALRPRIIGEAYRQELATMTRMLVDRPLLGFFSFGEQGLVDDGTSRHNNASVSVLVLGDELSESARVAEENRRLYDILEQRTTALATTNESLRREIMERQRAETALTQANQELRDEVIERQRAEDLLRESEERHRHILENLPDPVFVINHNGSFVYLNPAVTRVTGHSLEATPALGLLDVLAPESREAEARIMLHMMHGHELPPEELSVLTAAGSRVFLDTHFSLLRCSSQGVTGVQAVGRDITHEKSLARQLLQAEKMRAVGSLAGGIAHDFNNLLTAILGNVEMAQDALPCGHPVLDRLGVVMTAGQRARLVVRQLLQFTRPGQLEERLISMNVAVEESCQFLRAVIPTTIRIELDLQEPSCNIRTDPSALTLIVTNLCVNARDAMPDGGILRLETFPVTLDDHGCAAHPGLSPGPYCRLRVTDTGQGMTADVRDHVFEPFFTTRERGRGTGLGLFMVYNAVRQACGEIMIDSEPGRGSRFEILLPSSHDVPAPPPPLPPCGSPGFETVLLADDEEMIVTMGRLGLEKLGYRVLTACDGEHAVAQFAKNRSEINLVILDWNMPRGGGARALEVIRSVAPELPILVCSGYAEGGVREKVSACLPKPYTPARLASAVRSLLDEHRARGNSNGLSEPANSMQ